MCIYTKCVCIPYFKLYPFCFVRPDCLFNMSSKSKAAVLFAKMFKDDMPTLEKSYQVHMQTHNLKHSFYIPHVWGNGPHVTENIPTEEIILQYQFSNLTKFPKNMANTTKMCIKTNMKIIKFSKCSSSGKIAVEPPPRNLSPENPLRENFSGEKTPELFLDYFVPWP